MSTNSVIEINIPKKDIGLSKEKQRFNKLIKQVDKKKKELEAWNDIIPKYQHQYSSEYLPLVEEFDNQRHKIVYLLDTLFQRQKLTQVEKRKVIDLICNITSDLIPKLKDNKLKKLYNKYSPSNFGLNYRNG